MAIAVIDAGKKEKSVGKGEKEGFCRLTETTLHCANFGRYAFERGLPGKERWMCLPVPLQWQVRSNLPKLEGIDIAPQR